jgi:hypothetical protein
MIIHEETRVDVPPRIRAAIDELEAMIVERFPQATFVVQEGHDPPGIYLKATVDIDDTDEVTEIIIDRLIDLEVHEGLPLYFVPLRPIERVLADIEALRASGAPWLQRSA